MHGAMKVRDSYEQAGLDENAHDLQTYGIKKERSAFEIVETTAFDVFKDIPVEILHTILLVGL